MCVRVRYDEEEVNVQQTGVRPFVPGVLPRVMAIAPGSAISFFVYESIKEWVADKDK